MSAPLVVGIVGAEAAKFTDHGERFARELIRLFLHGAAQCVSGGCHLGGVDAWAAEEARALGVPMVEHLPASRSWTEGYKPRNLLIARDSTILHCIAVDYLPVGYTGMRFPTCYHHLGEMDVPDHVKSGGCWTMQQARRLGRVGMLHVVHNGEGA